MTVAMDRLAALPRPVLEAMSGMESRLGTELWEEMEALLEKEF